MMPANSFFKLILQSSLIAFLFMGAGCTAQNIPESVDQQLKKTPSVELASTGKATLNGDNFHLAWTYDAGKPINDSPFRAGDVVVAAPVRGPLLALDAKTGKLRWQFDSGSRMWERSYATDGERIFAGAEDGQFIALNIETGEVMWQKTFNSNVQVAPQVVGDILYVPTTFVGPGLKADPQGKAKLFALKVTDGEEIWSFETDNYILQTPFFHNNRLYVGGSYFDPSVEVDEGGPMRIYALLAQDGTPQWVYQAEDGFIKALYATDNIVSFIAYQDFVNGIDANSGELLWRKDTGNWVPSLSGAGDAVYFGSANTVVHALDMNSGESIWQYNIGGDSFNYGLGAPVRAGDTLYVLSQKGDVIALNAADGAEEWQVATEITGSRDGLTVSGDWLYIGDGQGRIYGFSNSGAGS